MKKQLDKFLRRFGYGKIQRRQAVFSGAQMGNLYGSWTTTNQSGDNELFTNLSTLRARSRELERNNDYFKKFLRMTKTNVVGKDGIKLQSMAMREDGQADNADRRLIESEFNKWAGKGICDVTGMYSFRDIQKMAIATIARDGEILIRRVKNFKNGFGYALQLIEADHLDEKYHEETRNGNIIRMGVELGAFNRPLAYHLWPNHPGDFRFGNSQGAERIRVTADEIFHLFNRHRISANRGLPWAHAAMTRLNMLGGYEEAELVAARIAANKGGFYKKEASSSYVGDDVEDDSPIQETEPGVYEVLPQGWDFQPHDPQHPMSQFADFEKAILRGVASGLDVSYNYLANDLENVNFSSIRAGVLDERDVWRDLQAWMIDHFIRPVFNEWLEMAILSGALPLPFSKIDKFKAARFNSRGWAWVDPLKDVNAKVTELKNGLTTASQIAAERGQDLETIYELLDREQQMRDRLNIKVDYDEELTADE